MAGRKYGTWHPMTLAFPWIAVCIASSCRSPWTLRPGTYRSDSSGVVSVFLEDGHGWLDNPDPSWWRLRHVPFTWKQASGLLETTLSYPTGIRETSTQRIRRRGRDSYELWAVTGGDIETQELYWNWVRWNRVGDPPTNCIAAEDTVQTAPSEDSPRGHAPTNNTCHRELP